MSSTKHCGREPITKVVRGNCGVSADRNSEASYTSDTNLPGPVQTSRLVAWLRSMRTDYYLMKTWASLSSASRLVLASGPTVPDATANASATAVAR